MRAGDPAPAIGDLRVLYPPGAPWSWAAVADAHTGIVVTPARRDVDLLVATPLAH